MMLQTRDLTYETPSAAASGCLNNVALQTKTSVPGTQRF